MPHEWVYYIQPLIIRALLCAGVLYLWARWAPRPRAPVNTAACSTQTDAASTGLHTSAPQSTALHRSQQAMEELRGHSHQLSAMLLADHAGGSAAPLSAHPLQESSGHATDMPPVTMPARSGTCNPGNARRPDAPEPPLASDCGSLSSSGARHSCRRRHRGSGGGPVADESEVPLQPDPTASPEPMHKHVPGASHTPAPSHAPIRAPGSEAGPGTPAPDPLQAPPMELWDYVPQVEPEAGPGTPAPDPLQAPPMPLWDYVPQVEPEAGPGTPAPDPLQAPPMPLWDYVPQVEPQGGWAPGPPSSPQVSSTQGDGGVTDDGWGVTDDRWGTTDNGGSVAAEWEEAFLPPEEFTPEHGRQLLWLYAAQAQRCTSGSCLLLRQALRLEELLDDAQISQPVKKQKRLARNARLCYVELRARMQEEGWGSELPVASATATVTATATATAAASASGSASATATRGS